MLVSLVPTAIILALLWQGAIKLPSSSGNAPAVVYDHEEIAGVQEASLAAVPAMQVDAKPDIALTAPDEIAAKTGDEVDFEIAIDSVEALPARSVIAMRLRLPKTASGSADMRVELMAADGTVLASASTKLDIVPDPKSALILRADESNRVTDLIAHGQKMIDVGYFAGARAYFRRAAEAGSGEAALRLAATYDQEFIDRLGVQGIKADPGEARNWYERAKQLGVEDADGKLKALKEDWTNHDKPVQATDIGSASPPIAETEPSGEASAAVAGIGLVPVPAAASPELPSGKDEWVALVGYANVRTAPSSAAETIRVAEKGTKLRVTGRKGNWVQVTDPATAEVGWVYARYIETAESPAR
jgi:hypothetical protein